jgi:phospholipase/carboxylesterase
MLYHELAIPVTSVGMSPPLEFLEVETGPDPQVSIIWLHGLGADGYDFEPVVKELSLPAGISIRFIFPHAPVRPVTINGGMPMRAWYDFLQLSRGTGEDAAHIQESVDAILELVQHEQGRGVLASRICLAGFSQGGVIALMAAIQSREPLMGAMGLSTYLPFDGNIPEDAYKIPVFQAHGSFDNVLPLSWAEVARNQLKEAGYPLEWHEYPMEHSVCGEEIEAISRWIGRLCESI